MSYSGSNWSRYSSSSSPSSFPFIFSSDRNSSSSNHSSRDQDSRVIRDTRGAHDLSAYNRHHRVSGSSNSSNSPSTSSSYSSLKSHPASSSSAYSSRTSPASSSSGYSSSSGNGYMMGHYVVSPMKSSGRDSSSSGRDATDYRSNRATKPNGSLPSQYSRLTSHQRTFSGTFDRKPTSSRPSSLYDTRAMRSFDSEYSQTPSGQHAVVHQLTIRPNVDDSRNNKSSKPIGSASARIERQGSISSMKSLSTSNGTARSSPKMSSNASQTPKEKKGLFNLKKRLSASLSSLVSSLGSLSYSMQDLSTSSADIRGISTPSPSMQKINCPFDNDDDDAEYSDSVSYKWSAHSHISCITACMHLWCNGNMAM